MLRIIGLKIIHHQTFGIKEADVVAAFHSIPGYPDDLLNIDNPYFEQVVSQIYHTELQLDQANSSDTEAPF